jgi:carbon-monoxide dehydrogenase medium subunit
VRSYGYYKPENIQEAVDLMSTLEDARYIAGGTDVMVLLRQKKLALKNLISLRNIGKLSYISSENGLGVGGATTHTMIVKDEFIKRHYSALNDAATRLGSKQIRNVATIGGNICNAAPSADTACPLLVFDAIVAIAGQKGNREVGLDDFFLGPNKVALEKGEIVKGFNMPLLGNNTGSSYIKHTRRQAMDLPMIGIGTRITIKIGKSEVRCHDALCTIDTISNVLARLQDEELVIEDARIAMGVVAPRPIRAKKAEAFLIGKVVSEKLFEEVGEIAAAEARPRDSIRGEAWYRKEMVKVLVRRALMRSIDRIIRPDDTVYPERLW